MHRKIGSQARSAAYYQSPEGKIKKRLLNRRRNRRADKPLPKVDQTLIVHIRVVASLIEGTAVPLADILRMVQRFLRQLSLDLREKTVYQDLYPGIPPP